MKRFKKAVRFSGLIVLIILACFGIGLGGTPPVIPVLRTKQETELSETKDDDENERK
ncbi:hypothetical protein [Pedobacter sp. B4-66]|uniref:hypothetical protein n=1 Tax=Pedobacter sp. B4-66 TaxID=2817280 RepID=UPI001BDA6D14|nr:hypothetical protein [Pedobacter sp. B4-66]